MSDPVRVLILCTGNSARSQMAEALVNHLLGDRVRAFSAGLEPRGLNPYAVRAMQEIGINIRHQRSKHVDEFRDADFDYVITLCDNAAEHCPAWLGSGQHHHIPFRDPSAVTGSDAEIMATFREVRDAIREQLIPFLEDCLATEPRHQDAVPPPTFLPEGEQPPGFFHVPARHNPRLQTLVERINRDLELRQLWHCANVNAVDRSGISDHGEVHIRIVANAALRLLRLLVEAGVTPSIVQQYGLSVEDAEVIVVLAACLHDIGISVHREDHEQFSVALANAKARQLLAGIYAEPGLTVMVSETLHAIIAHRWDVHCLTVEAGVVKVADALDMTEGRSRIPFEAGAMNIHAISAAAIDEVRINRGEDKPIRVEIRMSNSAGIFQIDELLKRKLHNSGIAQHVEVVARIEGETEKRLLELYAM